LRLLLAKNGDDTHSLLASSGLRSAQFVSGDLDSAEKLIHRSVEHLTFGRPLDANLCTLRTVTDKDRTELRNAILFLIFGVGGFLAVLMAIIATRQLWLMLFLFAAPILPLVLTGGRIGRAKPEEEPGKWMGPPSLKWFFFTVGAASLVAGAYLFFFGEGNLDLIGLVLLVVSAPLALLGWWGRRR
jgi:hypothetical protein